MAHKMANAKSKFCYTALRIRPSEEVPKSTISGKTITTPDGKTTTFDHVFKGTTSTDEVFNLWLRPKLVELQNGQNVSVLTFGYSGSGKTFSMFGDQQNLGLLDHALKYIQDTFGRGFNAEMEFFQMHMGKATSLWPNGLVKMPLREAERRWRKALENREEGKTDNNDNSSRSHALIKIEIARNNAKVLLTMVDLCGKEGEDEVPFEEQFIRECRSINADLHDLRTYFDNKSKRTQAALAKPLMRGLKDVLDSSVLLFLFTARLEQENTSYIVDLASVCGQLKQQRPNVDPAFRLMPPSQGAKLWDRLLGLLKTDRSSKPTEDEIVEKVQDLSLQNETLSESLEEKDEEIARLRAEIERLQNENARLLAENAALRGPPDDGVAGDADGDANHQADGAVANAPDDQAAGGGDDGLVDEEEATTRLILQVIDELLLDDVQTAAMSQNNLGLLKMVFNKCRTKLEAGTLCVKQKKLDFNEWRSLKITKLVANKFEAKQFRFQLDRILNIGVDNDDVRFVDFDETIFIEMKWKGACTFADSSCKRDITAALFINDGRLRYKTTQGKLLHKPDCEFHQHQ